MSELVNHLDLYRLPWNLADNAISWLEPTAQCNLTCDGCYRENRAEHKSFDETKRDLDVFARFRKSDALSIAGGDPLLYPDLLRTVAEAKQRGYKPVVNTNGLALTRELVLDLKAAGVSGFTFHVDSKQGRPGKWRGKNEIELCELRDELAQLLVGQNLSCSFNATVYPDTLKYVAELSRWAEKRMDVVDVMVFILYRDMPASRFRFYNGAAEVDIETGEEVKKGDKKKNGTTVYNLDVQKEYDKYVTADDIIASLRADDPNFAPSAYLNGTSDPTSFKWLLAGRVGRPGKTLGYVGPKFMELVQSMHHLWTGRYLAYAPPSTTGRGKQLMLLAPFDRGVRSIAKRFLREVVRSPLKSLFKKMHFQSVMVIQPIDLLEDGRADMCDGCPDITVWDGKLVWSCRLDEQQRYGRNVTAEPRKRGLAVHETDTPTPVAGRV